jgi:hypothetical protein
MSDVHNTSAQPGKRFNWLVAALIASLAVNRLIVGAVAARWYAGVGPGERYMRLTQTQLIPRRFFSELDRDRRMELLAVFRANDKQIRDGRRAVKARVVELADALEAEPYDAARARAAVEGFTANSEALFGMGSGTALTLIDMLTPAERKLMAQNLRTRDDRGRGGKDDDDRKPGNP